MAFVYWIHTKDQVDMTSSGYIGITTETVEKRFKKHQSFAKYDKYQHYPICRAIRKHGDDIIVETLLEGNLDYCLLIENKLRPAQNIGYNVAIGGGATAIGNRHSEETKKLIGDVHRGKIVSKETRKKQSEYRLGKKLSEATIKKLVEKRIGSKRSKETRQNISNALKGKPKSPQHCANLSKALQGMVVSNATRLKLSEQRKLWCNNKANPAVWEAACELYNHFKVGTSSSILAKDSGMFDKIKLRTIYKTFNSGWIPSEDASFMKWIEEQKEQNES